MTQKEYVWLSNWRTEARPLRKWVCPNNNIFCGSSLGLCYYFKAKITVILDYHTFLLAYISPVL
jgi:hypothetical protein